VKHLFFQLQIINVYNQEYESGAAFWPDVHFRIILALIVSQIVLMGLLTTKKAASSTPFLIVLPILTIWFHRYCKGRFESAFVKYPLQVRQLIILRANKMMLPFSTFNAKVYHFAWFCIPITHLTHKHVFSVMKFLCCSFVNM